MKLNRPTVVINDWAPCKEARPDRKVLADSLTTLLWNMNEGVVGWAHAPCGAGKTTFARMVRGARRVQKLGVFDFDTYASDYFDDPFDSFIGEMLELVETCLAAAKGITEPQREFKKTAVEVGRRGRNLGLSVGLRALTMRTLEAAELGELKGIGAEGATFVLKSVEKWSNRGSNSRLPRK